MRIHTGRADVCCQPGFSVVPGLLCIVPPHFSWAKALDLFVFVYFVLLFTSS